LHQGCRIVFLGEIYMSRMGDLIIGMEADAQMIIDNCDNVEEFCQRMQEQNYLYATAWCEEMWNEHFGPRRAEPPY